MKGEADGWEGADMDFNMLTRFSTGPRIVTWSFEGRLADADVNGIRCVWRRIFTFLFKWPGVEWGDLFMG